MRYIAIPIILFGVFGILIAMGTIPYNIDSDNNQEEILDPPVPPVPPDPPDTPVYDLSYFEEDGLYIPDFNDEFFEDYTLVRPEELGETDFLHPIILWADGSFVLPSSYSSFLNHMASHGFVVIGPNDRQTGLGDTVLEALDLLLAENNDPSSELYQKLDTNKICVMGHSQGGATAVKVGEDVRITCTVPIQPWVFIYDDASNQNGPMFLIASDEDNVCPPESNSDIIFASASTPTVYGILHGVGHLETLGDMGAMTKYITAWCYTHLYEDIDAQAFFYGDNATIYEDNEWVWQTKNM